MTAHKSVQADRDLPERQRQPGETDVEQTPLSLRNPLPRDEGREEGRPLRAGEAVPGTGQNAASNGYWLHDETGPKTYIAPDAQPQGGTGLSPADLAARIEERMGYLRDFDSSRVHVSIAEGSVILSGQVDTAEARRRAGACAVAAADGVPVVNRLVPDR